MEPVPQAARFRCLRDFGMSSARLLTDDAPQSADWVQGAHGDLQTFGHFQAYRLSPRLTSSPTHLYVAWRQEGSVTRDLVSAILSGST